MTPPRRVTTTETERVAATCATCGFAADKVNGLALAALHHDRTGHEVRIELVTIVVYGDREHTLRASGQTSLEDHLPPADQGGP